jgi:hypothetical protein
MPPPAALPASSNARPVPGVFSSLPVFTYLVSIAVKD